MTYVVTLTGYTPPARFAPDAALWTTARIEEAPDVAGVPGVWATIEGPFALVPPVLVASQPPTYDFTTENAALPSGFYRVVWIDADGTEEPTEAVLSGPKPIYAPTVGEVAALLHARTTKVGGREAGTFTATTRPSVDQVEAMIRMAAAIVSSSTGTLPTLDACPDAPNIASAVRALIAMRATLFIEPSLWPEQTTAGVGPYTAMREQYEAELPRVVDAVRDCITGGVVVPGEPGGTDGVAGPPGNAAWWFPPGVGYDVVQW